MNMPRTTWSRESGDEPVGFMLVAFPKQGGSQILNNVGLQPVGTLDRARFAYVTKFLHPVGRLRLDESTCVRRDDVQFYLDEPLRGVLLGDLASRCEFISEPSGGTTVRIQQREGGHFPSTEFFEYHVDAGGKFEPISVKLTGGDMAAARGIMACGLWLIVGSVVGFFVHRSLRMRWLRGA